jgi:hypothetical protein
MIRVASAFASFGAMLTTIAGLWTAGAWAAPGDGLPGGLQTLPGQMPVVDRAALLVQQSQGAVDVARRAALLAEAKPLLEGFLLEHPAHDDTARAEMWLGAVLTAEGKDAAAIAQAAAGTDERTKKLAAARDAFRESDRILTVSVDRLKERLKLIPKHLEIDTPAYRARESLKMTYIQALMYQAAAVEEWAATYAVDSDDARNLYKAAADRYEAIYRDYRILIAGLIARLKQGQCYRNLGDTKRALGLYNDILSQPDELSPLRRLRVTAMHLSLECWTTPQEKLYELAFSQGEEYLNGVRPEEKLWPEWQGVRYQTARGYLLAAEALPADRLMERAEMLAHARQHATAVGESEGPYREAGRTLLGDVGRAEGRAAP